MRNKLHVYIDNKELPVDNYGFIKKRNNSYGYVNILYLVSVIITGLSVLTVIFVGK